MKPNTRIIRHGVLLFVLFVQAFAYVSAQDTLWLDEMAFGQIVNPYGVPRRNTSFPGRPLNINGQIFNRGLGIHAPAILTINLNGKGKWFEAMVGIDSAKYFYHSDTGLTVLCRNSRPWFPADYVYDNQANHDDPTLGGTAIFRVLLDGKEVYSSGLMTPGDPARPVSVCVEKANRLTLIADPTPDGSYIDYVNVVNACLTMRRAKSQPVVQYYPEAVLVNHAGFHPQAAKTCYLHGTKDVDFQLIDVETQQPVYRGIMVNTPGNIGQYLSGDFSAFQTPGHYYLRCGEARSVEFQIHADLLTDCLRKHLNYISQQRSGHQVKGWRPGQHLDDGVRDDNLEYQDVVGGWNDACDHNKSCRSNASVLLALASLALNPDFEGDRQALLDEIRWGNDYLHKMQEPFGYLMTTVRLAQWTDNKPGTPDDRIITTAPADEDAQIRFILSQQALYQVFIREDSAYAQACLRAALRCYDWLTSHPEIVEPASIALMAVVNVNFSKICGPSQYRTEAEWWIRKLLAMKQVDAENHLTVFLAVSRDTYNNFSLNHLVYGLHTYASAFGDSALSTECRQLLGDYSRNYLKKVACRNAFGIMPFGISTHDMGSGKTIGKYHYRNFLHVGVNANLALKGLELIEAYKASGDTDFISLAQRQLDWIYGANPFNSSSVMGVGYNQPVLFEAGEAYFPAPRTPVIEGGVVTGICADRHDNITFYPGWWWSTEYWGPLNSAVIMLENELSRLYNASK